MLGCNTTPRSAAWCTRPASPAWSKGVRKYGPEPGLDGSARGEFYPVAGRAMHHWFPHIFSEAVDCANQTGLFADALGVDVLPEGNDV